MTRARANLLLLIAAMIWGTTFVVQKTAPLGPLTFTGIRFLLGALAILPLALIEARRAPNPLSRAHLGGFALCGAVLFLAAIIQQLGINQTSVTNSGFLTGLYLPMVPLLGLMLLKRPPHWSVWPASAGCVAGIWLLNGASLDRLGQGDALVLLAALFWALHIVLLGRFTPTSGRPLALATTQFVICGAIALAAALALEPITLAALQAARFEIAWASLLSVGGAYSLQVVAQRHTHPADAAIILSTATVFAALAGAAALGERIGPMGVAGGALVFLCLVLVEVLPAKADRVTLS
ncbi:MAG: DMT family transporter [Alphaproteobacteria bacterium]|nr:DMT family transporter [Alphaproteobacteria bacterium]